MLLKKQKTQWWRRYDHHVVQRRCQVLDASTKDLFAAMEFDDEGRAWELEGDLRDVIRYTRGSKRLVFPDGWRDLLPSAM